jgi:hypothetical protein
MFIPSLVPTPIAQIHADQALPDCTYVLVVPADAFSVSDQSLAA